ncbi:protein dopey-2 [Protopterus annectens]|uniref:protein dopey-2 n=1 Tax=Protopterus annectens TaxID=7888 RepID=UPI001CFB9836|nr:protein dopey-2 [Protopterus annectens]
MDPEEQGLLNDYRYRNYASVIEKALRNFESSSEWADLISSLGKLNRALQSNLKYNLLPKRLIICKRLAQCLHPALPSGVHLKALETYEIIFKIIGTKWLAKDLFLYSAGLFPLLANASMSIKPTLLSLYEVYYLPLQKALLPSLQAFVTGLLPGLEEGSEIYDRTDVLLQKLALVVGQEVMYGALWGSVLVSPSVRLPASLFVVNHISKDLPGKAQKQMLGNDTKLSIKSLCAAVMDTNVLVQRNILEILLFFFPLYSCLDADKSAIVISRSEMIDILSAASQTLLRRDMSLNRRLYAWLLGTDSKGSILAPDSTDLTTDQDHTMYYYNKYSKDLLNEALVKLFHHRSPEVDPEQGPLAQLKPFRLLICLLDKPEIGPQVVGDLLLEVLRTCFSHCKDAMGSDMQLSLSQSGGLLNSKIKENKNASEIIKTANVLISSLSTEYLWDYMTRCFEDCLRGKLQHRGSSGVKNVCNPPEISELCNLQLFLLEVVPLELYSEIQSQYLPQMLSHMVQCLLENMDTLTLTELTLALKTCFKVLNKIQMPAAYIDAEPGMESAVDISESPVKDNIETATETDPDVTGDGETTFPPLKSEDSGIGLSASSPELSQTFGIPRVSPENGNIWKCNGSMQITVQYIQEMLANFATRRIFGMHLQTHTESGSLLSRSKEEKRGFSIDDIIGVENLKSKKKTWDGKQISVPQFKQMLSDLFTIRGLPKQARETATFISETNGKKMKGEDEWGIDQVLLELEITEDCREAFAAICHFLLECAMLPVYLSKEETENLYSSVFQELGADNDSCFPVWLKSLMTLCCCVNDCYIQNVSISTLLELVNHSQSLSLVIEDRMKRYKNVGSNPFLGKLQMITVPPISPGILKLTAEKTDIYQRLANVLWNQLNKERREHHVICVELFFKLHCLAPSANICEDIICQSLLHRDKGTRLEALFRFSVVWHLTREIHGNRTTSPSRSFDRSLFVVLDSLNCTDGAISAAAQGWLVRALSLSDVVRILEPILLLLLHPKTQRTSIQCFKQNGTAELLHLSSEHRSYSKESIHSKESNESSSEGNLVSSQFTTMDREALWAEVEGNSERLPLKKVYSSNTEDSSQQEEIPYYTKRDDQDISEHTESADTSISPVSTENSSSAVSPDIQEMQYSREKYGVSLNEKDVLQNESRPGLITSDASGRPQKLDLKRMDSERTQASESLTSDEEEEIDLELQAIATARFEKQRKEKKEMVDALFKHVLLYFQPYDSKRVLYAFSMLEAVLKNNPKEFIEAVSTTSMDTSSTAHLNLIYNLIARHQSALIGESFYGKLQTQLPTMCPHSLLIELLTYLCLSFLRSYYPSHLNISYRDVLGNRDVQVKSVEVLIRIMTQLVVMAKSSDSKNTDIINNLLTRCKVQEFVLLSLSASMYASQKRYELTSPNRKEDAIEEGILEESLISFNQDHIWSEHPLQIELLKLLQVLIVLEFHLGNTVEEQESFLDLAKKWQQSISFQQSINAIQYVQSQPITSQGMFVSAVFKSLQPTYGYGMHPPWVSLLTSSLPYQGKSLGLVVAPFIVQICSNLDDLVKQYECDSMKMSVSITSKRENIAPDYPLTLLEGLTTICHFCLLENPVKTKKSLPSPDPANLRNAKNSILEKLPQIISTMAFLWSVIRREEDHKRPPDLFGSAKGSSSVYFRATKTLKQKILEFLNPLTPHLGVQLMAAVATVWNSKKGKKSHNKSKIVPAPSEAQLTLQELIKALSTLKTDTVLQMIKEVVRKPPQIKGEEKSSLVDIPMLQFAYAFIQRLPATALQENFPPLMSLLRESVQLNMSPPGHFLLLSILNDFVSRTPSLDNKKDQRDLQEVTQKILEAIGNIAGSSLEQTSWLSRNLEVKAQPQINFEAEDTEVDTDLPDPSSVPSSMVSSSAPSVYSVQALTHLAEILAPLLDMVYRSDEKEKAVPLISRLLYYVFPYLRNHSAYNVPSFRAGAQLLSSLSGYAYTKRAWKKEVLDLFLDPLFFQMEIACVDQWKSIVDHLLTHEKTMFKDLMNMQSSSLKLFANYEQKAMLLKRQAFAIFSGEVDQYHLFLPLIQERLTENLRVGQTPAVAAQMFLFFRVLLLRISPQHLTSLWPIMVTEMIHAFLQLEEDLTEEDHSKNASKTSKQKSAAPDGNCPTMQQCDLDLYLSACKFLDAALSFPPEKMPLFQMYRWAFVPEVDTDAYSTHADLVENHQECKPHVIRILELLKQKHGEIKQSDMNKSSKMLRFPLLNERSIPRITHLLPFFKTLSSVFMAQANKSLNPHNVSIPSVEYPPVDSKELLCRLEENIECDLLENVDI